MCRHAGAIWPGHDETSVGAEMYLPAIGVDAMVKMRTDRHQNIDVGSPTVLTFDEVMGLAAGDRHFAVWNCAGGMQGLEHSTLTFRRKASGASECQGRGAGHDDGDNRHERSGIAGLGDIDPRPIWSFAEGVGMLTVDKGVEINDDGRGWPRA